MSPDLSTSLIAFLDAALQLSKAIWYVSPAALLPSAAEYEDVRRVTLLWATANGCTREDLNTGATRAMMLSLRGDLLISLHIPDGCDFDPLPKPAEAPRIVVAEEPMWSPASEVA